MPHSRMKRVCAMALLGLLLSTAAVPTIAQDPAPAPDLESIAVRGAILAEADPLAGALRERLDEAGKRGFDIGMGTAEGQTAYGPGKQARGDALPADQRAGYFKAVEYLITRNANLEAAHLGARVAQNNPALKDARLTEDDPFYTLGFDIATGLLFDRGSNAVSELAESAGVASVRNTLRGAMQRGFDASASLNGRNYASAPGKAPPFPTSAGAEVSDSTTDGTAGVDRVGQVPNVVGLAASDAEEALRKAGYQFSEVTIKGSDPRPPFDVVQGTVPPAGTTLVAGSTVRYQLIDAAILTGTGAVNAKDFDARVAFDLDTGTYTQITHGADMFMHRGDKICRNTFADGTYRDINPCLEGSPLLDASDGAVMTKLTLADYYAGTNTSDGPNSPQFALKSRLYFKACTLAFSREPSATGITPRSYFSHGTYAGRPDNETITTLCFRTAERHLAVVRFAPQDSNGTFQFEYALFPDYPVLKAQGRVRLDPVPGAPATPQRSICEMAKIARDRKSPAAPGLTKQCLDKGGTVPQ